MWDRKIGKTERKGIRGMFKGLGKAKCLKKNGSKTSCS